MFCLLVLPKFIKIDKEIIKIINDNACEILTGPSIKLSVLKFSINILISLIVFFRNIINNLAISIEAWLESEEIAAVASLAGNTDIKHQHLNNPFINKWIGYAQEFINKI